MEYTSATMSFQRSYPTTVHNKIIVTYRCGWESTRHGTKYLMPPFIASQSIIHPCGPRPFWTGYPLVQLHIEIREG